jgi:hypothetical protein
MATIMDKATAVYVFVDDYLKAHPALAGWRSSPHDQPAFSDAEVITLALMQGCLGVATLKETYDLMINHYACAFPQHCGYKQWIERLHALSAVLGHWFQASRNDHPCHFYLIDSKPIPVCKPIRHGRVRLLREEGAYWGKTRAGWFFGFKLHVLFNHSGLVESLMLTPANVDDRDPALALAWSVEGGLAFGDVGYNGRELADLLAEQADLLLITPDVAGPHRALLSSLRERIETLFSQLWRKFIDRVFSRSWRGLWNTLKLKLIHYNLSQLGIIPA